MFVYTPSLAVSSDRNKDGTNHSSLVAPEILLSFSSKICISTVTSRDRQRYLYLVLLPGILQ